MNDADPDHADGPELIEDDHRARGWCFTHNNYTPADLAAYDLLKCTYIVYGKEIGEIRKTPHLQGWIYWKDAKTFASVKKTLPGNPNIRPSRALTDKPAMYCKKGEQTKAEWKAHNTRGPNFGRNAQVYERGVMPMTQVEKGITERERCAITIAEAKATGTCSDPQHALRFKNVLPKFFRDAWKETHDLSPTYEENFWIWGPTRCGKTDYVKDTWGDVFCKTATKWFDTYRGQLVVCIEDIGLHNALEMNTLLKLWADHSSFDAESKGGMFRMRHRITICTSNFRIRDIWPDPREYEAMEERFTQIEKRKTPGFVNRPDREIKRSTLVKRHQFSPGT